MVRNWQARVEAADTRRKEAKNRKQKSEGKRQHKQWVQEFQDLLDRNRDAVISHHLYQQHQQQQQQQQRPRSNSSTTSAFNGGDDVPADIADLTMTKQWKLSLWTDVPPSGIFEMEEDGTNDRDVVERKRRSKSFGDGKHCSEDDIMESHPQQRTSGGGGGKDRGRRSRSSSVTEPTPALVGKKKIHPRSSKEPEPDECVNTGSLSSQQQQLLCRSYFFTGLCDRSGGGRRNVGGNSNSNNNGAGCRYAHGTKDASFLSLHEALLAPHQLPNRAKPLAATSPTLPSTNHHGFSRSVADGKAQLKAAELAELDAANSESFMDHMGAMEMVYYLEAWLDSDETKDLAGDDAPRTLLWSDQMTQTLSKSNLYLASVVYVAIDGVLVFDRYQNGSLFATNRDFLAAVMGADAVTSRRERNDEQAAETIRALPGPVLAQILACLPDAAVAVAARVCRSWHTELTYNLPHVWRDLLNRHAWPHPHTTLAPSNQTTADTPVSCQPNYAEQFQQHYTVIRDMKALKQGLHAVCDIRSGVVAGSEMAYQEFGSRKHAPSQPNCCVGLQEWAPNQLLVAYQLDCSLRLFQTVAKVGKSSEKVCRELVCQRIDPYRNTKKRNCRIVALGLDEQCVASLCHVTGSTDAEAYIIVVISRDDFLLGESSGAAESSASDDILEHLRVIDVGESVLNYLVATDDGDPKLLELMDFLSHGGDVGEVEILASQTLATCGYGRFMVEVSISIPTDDDDDDAGNDGDVSMQLIDRRLFLFSASIGAIVWAGESCPPIADGLAPRRHDMTMSYLRRPNVEGGSRAACYFAVTSSITPAIMVGDIEPSGEVQSLRLLESSLLCWSNTSLVDPDEWETRKHDLRPLLVTSTDVVVADIWFHRDGDVTVDRTCILSFCARWPTGSEEPSYTPMTISGNVEVVRMSCIREHHIVLICRQFKSQRVAAGEGVVDRTLDNIAGHWFGEDEDDDNMQDQAVVVDQVTTEPTNCMNILAIVIHVPSRSEIGRLSLLEGQSLDTALLPHLVGDGDETIGLGYSWEGVVMTGHDVRSTQVVDEEQSAKKKKKKSVNKGFKKDPFRTHNGDRCY